MDFLVLWSDASYAGELRKPDLKSHDVNDASRYSDTKKVVPGIEPRLPESESDVLTITLYNHACKLAWFLYKPRFNGWWLVAELVGRACSVQSRLNVLV